jgi:hypothetical protein
LSNGGTEICHFRRKDITGEQQRVENAQAITVRESPRTTKLYDRTSDEITLTEVERIRIQLRYLRYFLDIRRLEQRHPDPT